MSAFNLALVVLASITFVTAAGCAKLYAIAPGWPRLFGALALYTVGNLIIIRVMREVGLGLAMSVSTVVQLIVVNLLAIVVFHERLSGAQYVGVALGVIAVALIVLFPANRGA